ncbi:MAG: hypothetical protein HONBIEJF_01638 [Fimbriimonadaceae bacterium]|nr:hypothetical protein [Fimbriimonadaceae bacterium]
MRVAIPLALLLICGCAKQEAQKSTKKDESIVGIATQEITGKAYQFHIPADWKPYDLTNDQFEKSINKVDVGKNPEETRQMLRQAKKSGIIHFMAFASQASDNFSPNVHVVVIPSGEKDLKVHFEGAKKQLEQYGKIVRAEIDQPNMTSIVEAEIPAGSPPQPVRTMNITKVTGKQAISLNYSYLPSQAERVKPAIDLAMKTFKTN